METTVQQNGLTFVSRGRTSEDVIRSIQSPAFTESWYPISHATLLDITERCLFSLNLQIDPLSKKFGVQKDGQRMFAGFRLDNQDSDLLDADGRPVYAFSIGLINSTDKSVAAKLVFGANIILTDAIVYSGEQTISRKHTKNIMRDIEILVNEALSKFPLFKKYQSDLFSSLTTTFVTEEQVNDILIRAAKCDAIPFSYIKKVLNEWENPQYPMCNIRSAWALYNCFSITLKESFEKNAIIASERTILLTQLFDQTFVKNQSPDSNSVVIE